MLNARVGDPMFNSEPGTRGLAVDEILTTMLQLMHKQSALLFEAVAEVAAVRKVLAGLSPEAEKAIADQIVIERARIAESVRGIEVLTSALGATLSANRN